MKEKLKRKLLFLREKYGIIGIKGGTEVEDMNFDELQILRDISHSIVPMTVKIGGAEARNDIRFCIKIGVDTILAPMIETEYALKNFIQSMKNIAEKQIYDITLAINLETISGYYNINQIIARPEFEYIKQVTVGRGDLAASMEKEINSKEVFTVATDIVERMKKQRKITSVGGKINPINARKIQENIQPHKINTRHISIELSKVRNLDISVCEALAFEIELYKYLMQKNKNKNYNNRIQETKLRINSGIPNLIN